MLKMALL